MRASYIEKLGLFKGQFAHWSKQKQASGPKARPVKLLAGGLAWSLESTQQIHEIQIALQKLRSWDWLHK